MKFAAFRILAILGSGFAIIACLCFLSVHFFGSLQGGLQYVNGRRIVVSEPYKDLGELKQNQLVQFKTQIKNTTSSPVKIIGRSTTCTCTSLSGLEDQISPQTFANFTVNIQVPEQKGLLGGTIRLFFDSSLDDQIEIKYSGYVH